MSVPEVKLALCPNPGPFTGPGTNTYVVISGGESVVIDPGPILPSHQEATQQLLEGTTPVAVLVTHTHPDHAPAANPLAERLGVPALGFASGPGFEPDRRLADLDTVLVGEIALTAVHTPGHTEDHLCFLTGDVLFTGDHIMGGSTVIIEDAAAYLQSLRRIADMDLVTLYPGHGPALEPAVVGEYIAHRLEREDQIVAAVAAGAQTIDAIVSVVYAGVPEEVRSAARRQVVVQLEKLVADRRVQWMRADGDVGTRVQLTREGQA